MIGVASNITASEPTELILNESIIGIGVILVWSRMSCWRSSEYESGSSRGLHKRSRWGKDVRVFIILSDG